MNRVILHLGYGKTATTTLQKDLFNKLHRAGRITYLGMFLIDRFGTDNKALFKELEASLYVGKSQFEDVLPLLRLRFAEFFSKIGSKSPIVISNEHFLLSSFSSKHTGIQIQNSESASRLARIFSDCEVTLIAAVRRQDSLVRSLFVQACSISNHANKVEFSSLNQYIEKILAPEHLFRTMYDFNSSLGYYRKEFPTAHFFIYTYERFCKNQEEVVKDILKVLGLQDSVPDSSTLLLGQHNRKTDTRGGTILNSWSKFHLLITILPFHQLIVRFVRHFAILRWFNNRLKKQVIIPALTLTERKLLLSTFRPSNRQLSITFPEIANELNAYKYIDNENRASD